MNPRMKFTFALIGILWLAAVFFGAFWHDKRNANDIDLATEVNAFRDVSLTIVKKEKRPDGSWSLQAETTYRGKPTGLRVDTSPGWKPASKGVPQGLVIYMGKAYLRSLGEESDRLLEMLDIIYGTQFQPKPMAKSVTFTVMSLEGNPQALDKAPVKLKLFFEPKDEARYAEFYLNVDMGQNQMILMEKDTDYRKPILCALRGE